MLVVVAVKTSEAANGTFTCTNCGAGPSWWQSILVAVLAGVIAAGAGAFFAYKFSQKLLREQLAEQSADQLRLMSKQTQHDAAKEIDRALQRVNDLARGNPADDRDSWIEALDIISSEMYTRLGQLNVPEIDSRVRSLYFATGRMLQTTDSLVELGVLRAIRNLENGLHAFIAGEPMPESTFLTTKEMMVLMFSDVEPGAGPNFGPYVDWIMSNPGPD